MNGLIGHAVKTIGDENMAKKDMTGHFGDRLIEAIAERRCAICVGLDPTIEMMPADFLHEAIAEMGRTPAAVGRAFARFCHDVIDAVKDVVPAVKPQMAFFEEFGSPGIDAFTETVRYAHTQGLIVIEDAKRNDIGSTAAAYARGHLGRLRVGSKSCMSFDVDAITVNPYLGSDGIKPFIQLCRLRGKGIFVLAKTSNPSSSEFQDVFVGVRKGVRLTLADLVAIHIEKWGKPLVGRTGFSSVGAVVGATFPTDAGRLRKIMPQAIFLVPGFGAQGASAADVVPCFDDHGCGALVNSSRAIIYAWRNRSGGSDKYCDGERFRTAVRNAAISARDSINSALKRAGRFG